MIIFIITSCKPSLKTCNKYYPSQIRDSIKTETIIKDTTIYIPGDTNLIEIPFDCKQDSLNKIVELYKGKSDKYFNQITWVNGKLKFLSERYEDSIKVLQKQKNHYEFKTKTDPVYITKTELPTLFWILLIYCIGTLYFFIKSFFLKK